MTDTITKTGGFRRTSRYGRIECRTAVKNTATKEDITIRDDLLQLADDGCPNITGDTQVHDLSAIWVQQSVPSKN